MYDTNVDVLIAKKSDYQHNKIGIDYFIVSKEEWLNEGNELKTFHMFLAKVIDDRVFLFLTQGKYPV